MKHIMFALCCTVLLFACLKEGTDTTEYDTELRTGAETTYQWYPQLKVFQNMTGTHQYQFENVDTVLYSTLPYEAGAGYPILVELKLDNGDYFAKKVRDTINTKKVNYTEIRQIDNKLCTNCGKARMYKTNHRYADQRKDSITQYRNANSQNGGRFLFISR